MPTTLQVEGTRSISPLSPHELLKLSTRPFVTHVHLQYQTTGHRAITFEEGPKPR
jgi:hypothetical protein